MLLESQLKTHKLYSIFLIRYTRFNLSYFKLVYKSFNHSIFCIYMFSLILASKPHEAMAT